MGASAQLHTPSALPPAKDHSLPSDRRLGGSESHSGRCGEEKNLALPEIEAETSSPVIPNELFWLLRGTIQTGMVNETTVLECSGIKPLQYANCGNMLQVHKATHEYGTPQRLVHTISKHSNYWPFCCSQVWMQRRKLERTLRIVAEIMVAHAMRLLFRNKR
jgi:hypothetical protein